MRLSDSFEIVTNTLRIEIGNRSPYYSPFLPSQTVALNGILILEPSPYFIDDDGHSLTINDAYYAFNNGITEFMPGSIFTFLSSTQIQVSPTAFSEVGTYLIYVRFTDS